MRKLILGLLPTCFGVLVSLTVAFGIIELARAYNPEAPLYSNQTPVCLRELHTRVRVVKNTLLGREPYLVLFPSGAVLRLPESELTECIPTEELLP